MININFKDKIGGHPKQEFTWTQCGKLDQNSEYIYRFIELLWGRQAGKDWTASKAAIKRTYIDFNRIEKAPYIQQSSSPSIRKRLPRLRYWAVAPTFSLVQTALDYFLDYIPEHLIQKLDWAKMELWLYPEILWGFKSADKPLNLVSKALNGGYGTETARWKGDVWNNNLEPCISSRNGWWINATTPLGDNHYIQDFWNYANPKSDKREADRLGIYCKSSENTIVPGFQQRVENARRTMPAKLFRRNYEAAIDAFEGQIYEEFVESVHVQEFEFNRERYKVVIAGQDWGYTHFGVLCIIGITFDNSVEIIHEIVRNRIPVFKLSDDYMGDTWVSLARKAVEEFDIEMIYAGVDEPEHIEAYEVAGLPVDKAMNAVKPGIELVQMFLVVDENGKSRYRVNASCTNNIQNKKAQKWIKDPEGIDSEKPEKKNDDSNDAERYALYSGKHWLDLQDNIA